MPEPGQPIAERRRALACGLLFSVYMTLAFPPFGWNATAFLAPLISITPLVWCALTTKKPFRAAFFAGIGSAPFWAFEHRWLIDVTLAGFPLVVLYLSIYPAAFVLILSRFNRVPIVFRYPVLLLIASPLIWVGLEVVRSRLIFEGYPWFRICYPAQFQFGREVTIIGISGACLITAVIPSFLGAMPVLIKKRDELRLAGKGKLNSLTLSLWVWLALFMLVSGSRLAYHHQGGPQISESMIDVAVLQTNVPQSNKIGWSYEQKREDFDRFVNLTKPAGKYFDETGPTLVVWPETMFPGLTLDPDAVAIERSANLRYPDGVPTTYFHDELISLQEEIGVPMLVGAIGIDGLSIDIRPDGSVSIDQEAMYNSAFLISDGVVSEQRYDKLHLTPFGEVMPYISASDWLESKLLAFGAPGMSFALEPGHAPVVFSIPEIFQSYETEERESARIVTPICFEGTMPGVIRQLVFDREGNRRADLIIQLTNDGWFGDWEGGREQHVQMLQWMAMLTGTPVIRAANTGVSTVISENGFNTLPLGLSFDFGYAEPNTEGLVNLVTAIPELSTPPFYLGNFIDWTTLAFTALVLILPMVHPGARRDRSANGADAPVINTDDADDHEGPPNADASDHEPRATTAEPDPDRSA